MTVRTRFPARPSLLKRSLLAGATVLVSAVVAPSVSASVSVSVSSVAPDTVEACQAMFDDKSDATWRAGDGNVTMALPGGRIAWLFGDTFRQDRPGVHNSVLVQEGGTLTSTTGGQAIPNETNGDYYWPTEAIMDGGLPRVFMGRVANVSGGFENRGAALATFKLDSRGYPVYSSKQTITSSNEDLAVQWGTAAVRNGDYVYVYGQRRRQGVWIFGRDVYLARVPVGQLVNRSAWRYWNGSGWVSDQGRAARIEKAESGRFASNFSVDKVGGAWLVVSKEADFLGDRIIRMEAANPRGPFTITSSIPTPGTDTEWAYQAKGHPELPLGSGRFLVTWNWGSNDAGLLFSQDFPKPRCGEQ